MTDPFHIAGPACISFSGGRTSALLLRRVLDAHEGTLPADVHVLFANTGKEREETLAFVNECAVRWGVTIHWVEWGGVEPPRNRTVCRVVDFASAHREGEPFERWLRFRGYLPGSGLRMCTTELKIRVMKRWMRDHGYDAWTNVVGLRVDEPARVARALGPTRERWENLCPLATAGITVRDVAAYWREAPFDLQLRSDEGNCDLCYMKSPEKRVQLMRERPESAAWWIAQEQWADSVGAESNRWRLHQPNYATLRDLALVPTAQLAPRTRQLRLFGEDSLPCACTD